MSLEAVIVCDWGANVPMTREDRMKTTIKLSLVAVFAVGVLATGIGTAQAARHHHRHHVAACAAKPGTFRAFFCPAAPAKK
jgi:hypothetical protein